MTRAVVDLNSAQKAHLPFSASPLWPGVWLALFVVLAYFPAVRGGFIWDDDVHISANPALHSLGGLRDIWLKPGATFQYYPLTFTGFWLGYHLWGLNPLGYHLLTLFFHICASLLLWQVLAHLNVRGAWLAGAIFALHPVNVMSVAWMTELKNTLSATLALSSAWAYLRFSRLGVYAVNTPSKDRHVLRGALELEPNIRRWYVLALALFVLAMLAKTAVSFLPVSLLLITWWQRQRLGWREVWPVLPMAGLVAVFGALTVHIERLGAVGGTFNLGFLDRMLISGRSFWFYLGKLLFPYPLTATYERWAVDAHAGWQYLYPAAAVALFVGLWWWRGRLGRGTLVAFLHFYVSTSLLILGVVLSFTRYSFVSDHWQYFGCMSVFALAAAGITQTLGLLPEEKRFLKATFCGLLLLLLGTLTWRQAWLYRNDLTLWRDVLAKNEQAWNAHVAVGKHLYDSGQFEEAMGQYRRAIQIDPNEAMAHCNYATTLWLCGRFDEAATEFQAAIRIKPDYYLAHANYCDLLLKRGKLDEAGMEVRQLLRIAPDDPVSLYHQGDWLLLHGSLDEAETQLTKAIQADPDYMPPRLARARLFRQRGQLNEAVEEYQSILQRSPGSERARVGLAETLCLLGRPDAAVSCYRDVLQVDPDNSDVRIGFGLALIEQGNLDGAEAAFSSVLQADPGNARAVDGLGQVLARQNRLDEARARFLESMKLDPKYAPVHLHNAMCLSAQRQAREAVMEYRKALTLDDQLSMADDQLAWLLATYPDPQIRNGQTAVGLAERACRMTNNEQPFYLGTLAAAYAEAGRFNDAILTAEKARDVARKAGMEKIAVRNEQLLELYRAGRPYHEPAESN
ncbi:MAG: tetratricopeptide repeat protein [Verrucomicrobiia bacterium]